MKPVILISPNFTFENTKYTLSNYYTKAIVKSGGIPLICPYDNIDDIDEILDKVDGVLLSGGGDIDAKFFNEELAEEANFINPFRDEFEIKLCNKTIDRDLPILAICRGVQIMAVAQGGNINQHIENHVSTDDEDGFRHEITIKKDSLLNNLFNKDKIYVNSIHHQSINNLPENFEVIAFADGVIEAIHNSEKTFTVGVQYHPERIYDEDVESKLLFDEFINKCKK